MKNVVFITRSKVIGGSQAPTSRNLLFAKMLAESGINVYLCSFETRSRFKSTIEKIANGIYNVGEEPRNERVLWRRFMRKFLFLFPTLFFLIRLAPMARKLEGETVIFQDWTLTKSIDIGVLLVFRICLKYKVYVDPNEYLASLIEGRSLNSLGITNELIRLRQFIGDYLLIFYSGLVIISSGLEKKFSRFNKNYIRIPIISNVEISDKLAPPPFKYGDIFKIGYFGTLQIHKEGLDIICSALNDLRKDYGNIEVHFYGTIYKPEREVIEKLFSSLDGAVFYHGVLTNEQARDAMKTFHLLVSARRLITQTKYGFSTKLAEYMSSGVPILVTNIGDNSLFIKDGENGYLAEPGSTNDFKEKLRMLIKEYENVGPKIAYNALLTAKNSFDYKNYSSKFAQFLFS
jgi:glycosyltransferase involved in cell wall biosynthesis